MVDQPQPLEVVPALDLPPVYTEVLAQLEPAEARFLEVAVAQRADLLPGRDLYLDEDPELLERTRALAEHSLSAARARAQALTASIGQVSYACEA